jgi:menaquinone-9 beta-reductase
MAFDAEVIVIGAGPAGAATALGLAGRGHDVILVDRALFPREKVCGEGLLPHGVDALRRLGVAPPADAQPFVGIAYHAGAMAAVGTFAAGGAGLGMRRLALDQAMLGAASAHPRIAVRPGLAVRGIARSPGLVQVDAGETLRARAVVGADGLHSSVRRWAGLHREARGRQRYAVRGHLRTAAALDRVEVHLAAGAEVYVTPVAPGEVNVTVLCEADTARSFKGDLAGAFTRLWRSADRLGERLADATPTSPPRAAGPMRQETRDVVGDGLLLVGDAAGFVDGITGEGMSLSLLSAAIAAEVLSAALRTGRLDAAGLRAYAVRRRHLARDLDRLSALLVWGIARRRLARRVVRNLARDPALFDRVLAIDTGRLPLRAIGLSGVARLLRP